MTSFIILIVTVLLIGLAIYAFLTIRRTQIISSLHQQYADDEYAITNSAYDYLLDLEHEFRHRVTDVALDQVAADPNSLDKAFVHRAFITTCRLMADELEERETKE